MTQSTLWLAELQFFLSLSFVAVFFAIELGLSWVLFAFRLRTLGGNQAMWLPAYRTWVRVFALATVLSIAASIPVIILLGTLWPQFLQKTALLSSPLLAAVIVTTLIFKSSFLGLMLYAQRRMPNWLHAGVVGVAALINTGLLFIILAWVSWLHHPVGAQWSDSGLQTIDWSDVFRNPLIYWYGGLYAAGSFLFVGVLIQALLARQSIRRPANEGERRVNRFALLLSLLAIVGLVVGVVGHGGWLAQHQPFKAAAINAFWHSGATPEWLLAAWSSEGEQKNLFSFGLRPMHLWWLGQDAQQHYIGLDKGVGMLPPVNLVFWSFRLALLVGGLLVMAQLRTWWLIGRRYFDPNMLSERWRHVLLVLPFLAAALMWFGLAYQLFGELPYVVYEGLTTSELYSQLRFSWLVASILISFVIYLLSTIGFVSLVRYAGRYGVIPVARHRGRA
ncbi:MAG TPA: cytochrome ubiquinol oxidase subunit I [Paenalcaligenes sp.]|nr:cytochrome ubiquinol oxidase subunit I [Paenalcaligenes sp.]